MNAQMDTPAVAERIAMAVFPAAGSILSYYFLVSHSPFQPLLKLSLIHDKNIVTKIR